MSTKLIVVIGATGIQGGSVARTFASKPEWRVRGITRNPDKPSNASLRDIGIELVAADLDDPASLDKAFEGANVIFANTDFWQGANDPSTFPEAEKAGKKPNQIWYGREVQQGKNAVDAAAKHLDTLEAFIWSTLSDTKKWSKGEFTWNLHFDSKAAVTDYIEESQPDLAAKARYLQVGMYLSNWKENAALRPHKQADGTFAMNIPKRFQQWVAPLVNPPQDVGIFVNALITAPAGSIMVGYCKEMTYGDFWRTWGKVQGVQLTIEDQELDFGALPEFLQWEFRDAFDYVNKYGFAGGEEAAKGPEEFGVDMSSLTDVGAWLEEEDFSSLL